MNKMSDREGNIFVQQLDKHFEILKQHIIINKLLNKDKPGPTINVSIDKLYIDNVGIETRNKGLTTEQGQQFHKILDNDPLTKKRVEQHKQDLIFEFGITEAIKKMCQKNSDEIFRQIRLADMIVSKQTIKFNKKGEFIVPKIGDKNE